MTPTELRDQPSPDGLSPVLAALWHDNRGDWERAHELAQSEDSSQGAHVHAYLHRKEGDEFNARYWYSRANAPFPDVSLDEEWEQLAATL